MNDLTPEQKKQLDSWASQRDAILNDIAINRTESEKLIEKNKELASSNTDISDRIQQSIGRLYELEKKEDERADLVRPENFTLIALKSHLQAEVSSLRSEIEKLNISKNNLHSDIESITKVHQAVFSRASDIERIVSETTIINSSNAREIKNILSEAGIELKKIIDVGSQNVAVTNRLISEVPKMIVDIHRDVIERKKINRHK